MDERDSIVALSQLAQPDLRSSLRRAYTIDAHHDLDDLLCAIDQADVAITPQACKGRQP